MYNQYILNCESVHLFGENSDTHATRIKGKKLFQMKSSTFNQFSSKRSASEMSHQIMVYPY